MFMTKAKHEEEMAKIRDQLEAITSKYEDAINSSNEMMHKVTEALQQAAKADEARAAAEQKLAEVDAMDKVKLCEENENLKKSIEQQDKITKDVQNQLSKALHEDQMWGFPDRQAFPGCTAVDSNFSQISEDERYAIIKGRTIFDAEVTEKINQAKTVSEKMSVALLAMKKQGVYDKMLRDLIMMNAVEYTMAYDENANVMELYYMIRARLPESVVNFEAK